MWARQPSPGSGVRPTGAHPGRHACEQARVCTHTHIQRHRQICGHISHSLEQTHPSLPGFWTLWGEEGGSSEVLGKRGNLSHFLFPLLCQALGWALTGIAHPASYLPAARGGDSAGKKTPNPVIPGHSHKVPSHSQRQARASGCLLMGGPPGSWLEQACAVRMTRGQQIRN